MRWHADAGVDSLTVVTQEHTKHRNSRHQPHSIRLTACIWGCTIEIMTKKKRRGVWLFLAILLFPIYFVFRWLRQFANS